MSRAQNVSYRTLKYLQHELQGRRAVGRDVLESANDSLDNISQQLQLVAEDDVAELTDSGRGGAGSALGDTSSGSIRHCDELGQSVRPVSTPFLQKCGPKKCRTGSENTHATVLACSSGEMMRNAEDAAWIVDARAASNSACIAAATSGCASRGASGAHWPMMSSCSPTPPAVAAEATGLGHPAGGSARRSLCCCSRGEICGCRAASRIAMNG